VRVAYFFGACELKQTGQRLFATLKCTLQPCAHKQRHRHPPPYGHNSQ